MLGEKFTGAELAAEVNDKLSLANGGIITGKAQIENEPADEKDLVNKEYVDRSHNLIPGDWNMGVLSFYCNDRIMLEGKANGESVQKDINLSSFNVKNGGHVTISGEIVFSLSPYGNGSHQYYYNEDVGVTAKLKYITSADEILVGILEVPRMSENYSDSTNDQTDSVYLEFSKDIPVYKNEYGKLILDLTLVVKTTDTESPITSCVCSMSTQSINISIGNPHFALTTI